MCELTKSQHKVGAQTKKKLLGWGGFTHLRERDIICLTDVWELAPNELFFIFVPPLSTGYLEVGVWYHILRV